MSAVWYDYRSRQEPTSQPGVSTPSCEDPLLNLLKTVLTFITAVRGMLNIISSSSKSAIATIGGQVNMGLRKVEWNIRTEMMRQKFETRYQAAEFKRKKLTGAAPSTF